MGGGERRRERQTGTSYLNVNPLKKREKEKTFENNSDADLLRTVVVRSKAKLNNFVLCH